MVTHQLFCITLRCSRSPFFSSYTRMINILWLIDFFQENIAVFKEIDKSPKIETQHLTVGDTYEKIYICYNHISMKYLVFISVSLVSV